MRQYIALLRGINVSGQKKILMADLKKHCQSLGLSDITTYIQSGNIIFSSQIADEKILAELISEKINAEYGFDVPTIVVDSETLTKVIAALPFNDIDPNVDGNKVYMGFLNKCPSSFDIDNLMTYVHAPEKLTITGNILYLHCPNGYGKTKLSNNFCENKLKVICTTRNLKTVTKLQSLVR